MNYKEKIDHILQLAEDEEKKKQKEEEDKAKELAEEEAKKKDEEEEKKFTERFGKCFSEHTKNYEDRLTQLEESVCKMIDLMEKRK